MKRILFLAIVLTLLFSSHAGALTTNYFHCVDGASGSLVSFATYTSSTVIYPHGRSGVGSTYHFQGRAPGGGGGGARGGSTLLLAAGGAGAAGELFDFWCMTSGNSASITIGSPGAGGGATGLTGSDGGSISITCGGQTIVAAGGGAGYGQDGTSGGVSFGGVAPGGICAAGSGDATLIPGAPGGTGWSFPDGAGWVGMSGNGGGDGGGRGCMAATSGGGIACTPNAGANGGGGAGGLSWTSSGGTAGANGGGGFVTVTEFAGIPQNWNAVSGCSPM
ncbi:MAG: hypothetical protein WCG85_23060 [Polyangia bacterium]